MNLLQEALPFIVHSFLGLAGFVGLLALLSPKMFAQVAEMGGLWVAAPKREAGVDKFIDIDQFILKNSRQFGALVVVVVTYLLLFFTGRIDPSWTPVFLLFVMGFSVLLALSGLIELGGEVSKIEAQLADARIDCLTGLANRRVLDDELERRLSELTRQGAGFCIAMFDVDHFKEFNDKYGHLTGDTVLTEGIADVIRKCKRTMDLAARYGGDEFAVIYPTTTLVDAGIAVENLRQAITEAPLSLEDAELAITISIGVAEAVAGDDVRSLISRADEALYAAKKAGRNRAFGHNGETCQPIVTTEQFALTV